MPPTFLPNYPLHPSGRLLSTPERLNASPDYSGRGVVIAFIDSAFYMHPDLGNRVLLHVDATTNRIQEQERIEQTNITSWHGQMVSVIAAGDGHNSGGYYRGLAYNSELVLIKVSNPRLQVKEVDIVRGFKWLIEHHSRFNIRIVNVSVGGDFVSGNPEHPLHRSVQTLVEAGVTVVISSGNKGEERLVPPASSPHAIIVGGYNDNNSLDRVQWRAYHSNYGQAYDGRPKPDIIAPAEWIASPIMPETDVARQARWLGPLLRDTTGTALKHVLKRGYRDLKLPRKVVRRPDDTLYEALQGQIHAHKLINENYQHVDGTSVAAPIVTSLIAQMLETNPTLTPEHVRSILTATAQPLADIPPERQGAGAINARAAVEAAKSNTR
jgi:serine protease AprX